eukprot:12715463-Alexandrium_andersonii.AAC.1
MVGLTARLSVGNPTVGARRSNPGEAIAPIAWARLRCAGHVTGDPGSQSPCAYRWSLRCPRSAGPSSMDTLLAWKG